MVPTLSLTRRLGAKVLLYTRHVWFRYAYPAVFLGTALSRRGTVACGCYCATTIFLTCIAACAGRTSSWRRTHVVLVILCLTFFITALTLEVLCAIGQLPDLAMRALVPWGFGGIQVQDTQSSSCGGTLKASPEAIAVCAAVIGWLLGVNAETDQDEAAAAAAADFADAPDAADSANTANAAEATGASAATDHAVDGDASVAAADTEALSVLRPPLLADMSRAAMVGVLLIACAVLDCNLFAAVYYAAALVLMLNFAWLATLRPSWAHRLRGALLIVAALHLITVVACSFVMALDHDLPYVVVLLGAEQSHWCFVQCLASFVLFQVLLLCKPPAIPAMEVVEVVSEQQDAGEALAPDDATVATQEELKRALIGGDGAPLQGSELRDVITELSEVASVNLGHPRPSADSARAASSSAGSAVRIRPLRPSAARSAAGVLSSFASAQSTAGTHRSERQWQPMFRDAGLSVTQPGLTRSSSLMHSVTSAVKVMLPWLVSAADALGKSECLPLLSLLSWPLLWPALPTLPLLLCGLLLLHLPLNRLPRWLLHAALGFEAMYSVVIYAYNVYCQVVGMPPSEVPSNYTWAETLGLQTFSRMWESGWWPDWVRIFSITLQASSQLLLSLNCRFVGHSYGEVVLNPPGPEATQLEQRLWDGLVVLLRSIFAVARPVTVGAVLAVALVPLNVPEELSLFGLGYMCWVLCLALSGYLSKSEHAGWDILRANIQVWRCLLLYSQALMVVLFCWQAFATEDVEFVGLRRSKHGMGAVLWPHMVVAMLAAVQTRTLSAGVLQPNYFLSCNSVLAQFLWYFGIFIEMALLFITVFLPPTSFDSFLFLLFFIIVVGIEQFSPRRSRRNPLLFIIATAAAILLPLRYSILIPQVQLWLSQCLRQVLLPDLLSILALEVSSEERPGACWKLAFTAVLLLFTCLMHRLFTLRCQTTRDLTFEWVPQNPVVVRTIIIISTGSTSMLMFVASFLMIKENLLSRLQLVVLTALLISGRRWHLAGAIISACSMGLLLAQYISRFQFTFIKLTHVQAQYLGFVWDSDLVASEVILLLCGIAQGVLARTRANLVSNLTRDAWWVRLRKELAKHGAQIGTICLLLVAVFHRSVCSSLSTLVIICYFVSRDSSRLLTAKRANIWLFLMASVMACSLLYAWGMELWRPPLPLEKPTYEDIAKSWACSMYDGNISVDIWGIQCHGKNCFTERQRCGQAWSQWLGLQWRGDLLSVFVSFFVVCLLRKACIVEMDHETRLRGRRIRRMFHSVTPTSLFRRSQSGSPASEVSANAPGLRDANNLPLSAPLDGAASGIERQLSPFSVDLTNSALSSAADLGERPPSQIAPLLESQLQTTSRGLGSDAQESGLPASVTAFRITTFTLWFSIVGAVIAQPQTDFISILYLLLLFVHVNTVENTTAFRNPFQARVRVLRYIRIFNLILCLVWIWYQCPLCPCPYELTLQPEKEWHSEDIVVQSTYFISPEQCLEVQKSMGSEGSMPSTYHALSIVLQCIGLRKTGDALQFDFANFWNALVFASSLALAAVSSRWASELSKEIQHDEEQMQMRECWYIEYLTAWRGLEISRIDTKHDVLHTKLKHLILYINEMRLVWANKRPAPDNQEEYSRAEEDRILDLCLQSGVQEVRMKDAVQEFNAVVEDEAGNEVGNEATDYVRLLQERMQVVVDQCVLEYFQDCALSQLQKITALALLERKQNLLSKVREEAKVEIKSLEESDEESTLPSLSASKANPGKETATAPPEASAVPGPEVSADVAGRHTEQPRTSEQEDVTVSALTSASNLPTSLTPQVPDAHLQDNDKETRSCCAEFLATVQSHFRSACLFAIDDLLFKHSGDETLWDHRHGNSSWQLAGKALQSQSLCLLMIAAVLQFASYMSILSTVTVCAVLLSLFAFPHSPPLFWRLLKWYNMFVIIIKMLFQLPVVCSNGQLRSSGCPMEYKPMAAVFGLRKVDWNADGKTLAFNSLLGALWADLLVCTLLFFHWHGLWQGGRLGNPAEIRRHLDEEDSRRPTCVSSANSPRERDSPSRTPRTSRTSSFNNLQSGIRVARTSGNSSFCNEPPQGAALSVGNMNLHLQESRAHSSSLRDVRISTEQNCLDRFLQALGSANVRRPALDLYAYRFWLAIVCLIILLTCWSYLSGSSRSLASSISGGNFSGMQVILAILFLAMVIIDRGLYTWSMQMSDRSIVRIPSSLPNSVQRKIPARVLATVAQKFLLVTQLLVLHSLCIGQWFALDSPGQYNLSLFHNPWLLFFYVLYIIFLVLTSLQLKYQVYMTRGGLGLTHSTDLGTRLIYKVYCLMPFMEEVRVLTDWTMTQTSLDFFMWMKLEDAQQGLYRDACDMELRRALPPGEARPTWEKVCQGGLLVLLLFCIIVGPLAFFSTLNFLMQPNLVSLGSLSASLQVKTGGGDSRRALLYEAGQASQVSLDKEQVLQFVHNNPDSEFDATDLTLQDITFPESSDTFWLISPTLRQQFAELLNRSAATASIVFQYTTRTSGGRSSTAIYAPEATQLNENRTRELLDLLNATNLEGKRAITIPNAMSSLLHLDAAGALLPSSKQRYLADVNLTLNSSKSSLPFWSVSHLNTPTNMCTGKNGASKESCPFQFQVASDKIAPDFMASGGGSSTFTVTGIYIGVVYTIGRFLRLAFQDSSQRIIYEELPDTKILLDLCNGIYIARIQGDLEKEYELYYELIRIYRSPQLLLTVSDRKNQSSPICDEDAAKRSPSSFGSELRKRKSSSSGHDSIRAADR